MKTEIYSLFDRAVATYARPMFAVAAGQVLRDLKVAVNDQQRQENLVMHSADFDLYKLGSFDDQTGRFELLDKPELVLNCGALKEVPVPPSAA